MTTSAAAARVAHRLNEEPARSWQGLADGGSASQHNHDDEARCRARSLGDDYVLNDELLTLPAEKRLQRSEALVAKGLAHDPAARSALLGTAKRPAFNLSRLFEEYEDLRPTRDHTVYSLRHSFKDRLVAAEAPDSLIDSLMGHKSHKPKYGKGSFAGVELKFLEQIAFMPPGTL